MESAWATILLTPRATNRSALRRRRAPGGGSTMGTQRVAASGSTLTTNTFPAPNSAFGFLDTTTSTNGNFAGWAFDPNAYSDPVSGAPSIFVDVYVDGQAGSGGPGFRMAANAPRPDVNSAYGSNGNHGFNFTFPVQY